VFVTRRLRIAAVTVLVTGMALMTTVKAEAAAITGDITFSGLWVPTGGTGIANATGVDVVGNVAVITCAALLACTGDYAVLNGQAVGNATYNDFSFAPLGPPTGGPVAPLWTFVFGPRTYSFNLETVTVVSQASTGILLSGTGMLNITGLAGTTGQWTFSGDGTKATFAFSSTATAVPEGGSTTAFLGLGLLGLAILGRRGLA